MKCARCLWGHKEPSKTGHHARDAITVYEGHALCGVHLSIRKLEKKEAGEDPWTL